MSRRSKPRRYICCIAMLLICFSFAPASHAVDNANEEQIEAAFTQGKTEFTTTFNSYIGGDLKNVMGLMRPANSVYVTTDNVTTEQVEAMFGGTWVQITDRFLYASSADAGTAGGTYTEALNANYLPSHGHSMDAHNHRFDSNDNSTLGGGSNPGWRAYNGANLWFTTSGSSNTSLNSNGSSYSHNNMPPYYAVKMFKRVA